jgi:hypothetical protein
VVRQPTFMRKERAVQDSSGKDARCAAARAAPWPAASRRGRQCAWVELMELEVTWGELDYSSADWIPPPRWLDFAAMHHWQDRAHVERLFALVTDIALHSTACAALSSPPHPQTCRTRPRGPTRSSTCCGQAGSIRVLIRPPGLCGIRSRPARMVFGPIAAPARRVRSLVRFRTAPETTPLTIIHCPATNFLTRPNIIL